ncbi:sugar kinase [Paenibacillus mendelii]|uniref:Sugar kinase n=1 Tax=Paenibacillus mendelii TaxID=206163 RepID=A0ABV6J2R2_9BACL|nr:sugar kinase [Paenibacillus mendelii]MCQ6559282.1 sugar kinase [Paenibacillus mendelii]
MSKTAAFGEVMMRLEVPGYGTLSQDNQLKYSFSGSGVNVMSALARYGHESYLVTTLPDNPLGEAALSYLRKLDIRTSLVHRGGKYVGMYFLEHGFGARPSRVTYTDRLGSSFNTAAYDDSLFGKAAQQVELMHFCGITLAMNDNVRGAMKRLAREVKRSGGQVVFDCNYRPSLWGDGDYDQARPHYEEMLELADIVLMNERDALLTLGMESSVQGRMAQLQDLVPRVAKQYRIQTIAGTHRQINGDNTHSLTGYVYGNDAFYFARERTFSVYDRVGAGDAFASGIIHGVLQETPLPQAVEFAAAAAMLAHTVSGDTPIASSNEVLKAMTDHIGDVER